MQEILELIKELQKPGSVALLAIALGVAIYGQTSANKPARSRPQSTKEEIILQIQQFLQQNQQQDARAVLNSAFKLYPGDAGLEKLRCIIEAQEGHYRVDEQAFTAAITRSPGFTNAYLNLGRLYQERLGDDAQAFAKALKTYRQLLRYQPENAEANFQCAVLLQKIESARASLPHLLRLSGEHQKGSNVQALLCAAYTATGGRARANDTASRLLAALGLSEQDVLSALPVLMKYDRADLALRLLEELARRERASPETIRQLGYLYEQQNQLAQARAVLEKAGTPTAPLLLDLARIAF